MRHLPPLLIGVQGVRLLREIAVDLRPRRHAEEAQAPPRDRCRLERKSTGIQTEHTLIFRVT
jgi:hypothetical protein